MNLVGFFLNFWYYIDILKYWKLISIRIDIFEITRKDALVYKISSVELIYCACKSEITVAMKQVRMSKKCEQRAVIKFFNVQGVGSNKIQECMRVV